MILFAGVCALGPSMLLAALRLQEGGFAGIPRVVFGGAVAFEVLAYASLYTNGSGLFIEGAPGGVSRGPLFGIHAIVQWGMCGYATVLFASSAAKVRGKGRLRGVAVVAGAGLPLLGNWVYLGLGVPAQDPTPLALALGAVSLRWGINHLVGAPFLATLARSELLDQLDTGILVADRRGRVLEASRGARKLLPGTDPIGAFLGDLLALFAGDSRFDVRRLSLERHGRSVGIGAIVNDRRDQRAAEQQAEVATRMEALGALTQGLAHEINNPLGAVLGSTEMLVDALREEADLELDPRRSESGRLLRAIEQGGERIALVVRRMQLLSDVHDQAVPGRAEVRGVTERAISFACLGKGRDRVSFECPPGDVYASVRPNDLLQILLHVVGNALESSVDVEAPVRVLLEHDHERVAVRILDRAHGLPEGDPSRVFHPFYTTRDPGRGLGLGLSLSWELARQNGGSLEAHARDGGGVEIRLVLVAAEAEDRGF